jgi:hypothetical protein
MLTIVLTLKRDVDENSSRYNDYFTAGKTAATGTGKSAAPEDEGQTWCVETMVSAVRGAPSQKAEKGRTRRFVLESTS